MEKTNFTFVAALRCLFLPLMMLFTYNVNAQIACNDNVQISVAADATLCSVEVTPDMITEGDDVGNFVALFDGPSAVGVAGNPATIDAAGFLGELLTVKVYEAATATGNYCWGSIVIEDKVAPECEPLIEATIFCDENTPGLPSLSDATVTDNDCGTTSLEQTDETTDDDLQCSTGVTITRMYVLTDAAGNVSEPCSQLITILQPTGAVDFPEDVTRECADYTLASVAPTTAGAGVPSVAEGEFCSFTVSSDDQTLAICESSVNADLRKIIRTWTVLDWCTNTIVDSGVGNEDNVQIIKVVDTKEPVISPELNIVVSANTAGAHPQPCVSNDFIPAAEVFDACSGLESIVIYTPVGVINGNGGNIPGVGLPIGTHTINYVATDNCGNTSEVPAIITVVDDITPTPVCDEITQVAVNASAGEATVYAETFDDGSNDNCGIDFFDVARMTAGCGTGTAFGPSVTFCCDDVQYDAAGDLIPVMVVFRVTDYEGLTNTCMVEVLVEDKIAPVVTCDMTIPAITCTSYFNNYQAVLDILASDAANDNIHPDALNAIFDEALVTAPTVTDNCGFTTDLSWGYDVDNCGNGTITRTWSNIEDNSGNSWNGTCVQTIEVNHENSWSITFPEDKDWECDEDSEDLGEPDVFEDNCELIAISMEDQLFNIVPDACYKIFRTYTAINWCVYNGNESSAVNVGAPAGTNDDSNIATRRYADGGDGIVVYRQIIKVQDFEAPVITLGDDVDGCITGPTSTGEVCKKDVVVNPVSVTDCDNNGSDIVITYTLYTIADVELNSTETTSATDVGRTYSDLDLGDYKVIITAMDNCGNQSSVEYLFSVTDCKAPTPYCVGGLVAELMPMDEDGDGQADSGMVELWASDFNVASEDNCSDVTFLMTNGVPPTQNGDGGSLGLPVNASGVEIPTANWSFDCSDLEGGLTQSIYLYVIDESGNIDVCNTFLTLETVLNIPGCGGPGEDAVIAGALETENNAPLAGATVSVNNGTSTVSSATGAYSVSAELGTDVTVTPEYNVYDNTSVTTYDLVLIRQHILTTNLLDSPYKVIAADINNNGSITGSDLVAAKQVILGMASSYPNNNAWVFVSNDMDSNWTLADGYSSVASFNNISADQAANFVAVRVGDVNGTYGFADDADERNSFNINANDAKLVAGQEFTVEFSAADAVAGYQFTLDFNNLEVVSIDGNTEDFGVFANAITTSFNGEKAGDKLFAVTFKATADVQVSEALAITNRITAAQAYNTNGAVMPVALNFNNTGADFALYQNTPNPVADFTNVSFDLATAGTATITVSDMTGKVVTVVNGEYAKGYNQVTLTNLPAGVLTYTLESADFSATKTMVVVK